MKFVVAGAMFLFCGALVHAQDRTYLNKSEIEQTFVGKTSTHLRLADGQKVKWDIRAGGMLYGTNLTGGSTDTARWEIKDDGALCVKWRGRSQDGCFFHFKNGEKLVRTDTNQPTASISSEILEIQ